MKPWRDLSEIPWPANVAALPLDERGYPIPATVWWKDGKPDFRVMDPEKWLKHAMACQCGICGQTMENDMVFVGGPNSAMSGHYVDLPMHEDCAVFALKACPFIAMPNFAYRKSDPEGTAPMVPKMEKPDFFVMVHALGYKPVISAEYTMLQAIGLHNPTAWREGRMLEPEELLPFVQEKFHVLVAGPKEEPQPSLPRMSL